MATLNPISHLENAYEGSTITNFWYPSLVKLLSNVRAYLCWGHYCHLLSSSLQSMKPHLECPLGWLSHPFGIASAAAMFNVHPGKRTFLPSLLIVCHWQKNSEKATCATCTCLSHDEFLRPTLRLLWPVSAAWLFRFLQPSSAASPHMGSHRMWMKLKNTQRKPKKAQLQVFRNEDSGLPWMTSKLFWTYPCHVIRSDLLRGHTEKCPAGRCFSFICFSRYSWPGVPGAAAVVLVDANV